MNGETMYALKPIITSNIITNNSDNSMYKMKNIHEICTGDDHASSKFCNNVTNISEKVPLPEVALLEARQEKILAQLAELKEKVLCLCSVLKSKTDQVAVHSQAGNETNSSVAQTPVNVDLIVRADPEKPCWSLIALQKVWKDVDICVKSYRHSSIQKEIPDLAIKSKKEFQHRVNVDLIWKKVEDTEAVVHGFLGYPLVGEANLLRYLARRLSDRSYGPSSKEREISELENILDISHRLHYQESQKDTQTTLSEISKKLEKKNWLSGERNPGIGDIAAWSAIKKAGLKKLPSGLNAWYEKCENTFLK